MCKGVTGVRQTAERDTWLETARRTAREILFGRVVPPTHEPLVKLHPGCRLDAPFPLTPALSPGRGRTAHRFMVPIFSENGVGAPRFMVAMRGGTSVEGNKISYFAADWFSARGRFSSLPRLYWRKSLSLAILSESALATQKSSVSGTNKTE